jgi:hypothetical protein
LNSASHPPVPTPVSSTPPPISPRQTFHPDLENLISQLKDMDRDQNQSMIAAIGGMREDYLNAQSAYEQKHPGSSGIDPEDQRRLDRDFQSSWPKIQRILNARDQRFQSMLPEIEFARKNALQQLGPLTDPRVDTMAYKQALAEANKKVTLPLSWNDAGFLYGLNYTPMESYLQTLEQRVIEKK